jgi:hypothetical protein
MIKKTGYNNKSNSKNKSSLIQKLKEKSRIPCRRFITSNNDNNKPQTVVIVEKESLSNLYMTENISVYH